MPSALSFLKKYGPQWVALRPTKSLETGIGVSAWAFPSALLLTFIFFFILSFSISQICPCLSISVIKLNHMEQPLCRISEPLLWFKSSLFLVSGTSTKYKIDHFPPVFYSSVQACGWNVRWVMRQTGKPPCGISVIHVISRLVDSEVSCLSRAQSSNRFNKWAGNWEGGDAFEDAASMGGKICL